MSAGFDWPPAEIAIRSAPPTMLRAALSAFAISSFLTVPVLLVACSSDSDKPAGPAPEVAGTSADLDGAVAARAKAYCGRVFKCCEAASQKMLLTYYAGGDLDEANCEGKVKEWLASAKKNVAVALERKDAEFFPSREKDCLKADDALSCKDFFARGQGTEPVVACAKSFNGKLKEGGTCSADGACETSYCKFDGELGKCAKRGGEGAACGSGEDCESGLYCHRTKDNCDYTEGECRARPGKDDGATCCQDEECSGGSCAATKKGPMCTSQGALKCAQ